MKRVWVLLIYVFVLAGLGTIEQRTITGKVVSAEDGVALPCVNVVLKGAIIGTTTNIEGEYQLKIPASEQTLVFSFIGLQTKEISVGEQNVINVSLEEDAVQLSEAVISTACYVRKPLPEPSKQRATKTSRTLEH